MRPSRVISALEPLFVIGLLAVFALVGSQSVSSLISRNVNPLATQALAPEESPPIVQAQNESQTSRNR